MNGHAANVRGRNAGRGGDGRLDAAAAQVVGIRAHRVRFARAGLAGEKHVGPCFKNFEGLGLSHESSIPGEALAKQFLSR
jgi:hypothetical protein